ncbi:MAG: lamin tail domain-containing protein [Lentimicrobium sp.]|jgi:hypothetical protein|nr:lamin tail domain-containing protein [Lentimicrobium sp.]
MRYILGLLLFFPLVMFGQVSDDFSDGDFTNNPVWTGDEEQFIVNVNRQLQLQSTGEAVSYLSTPAEFEEGNIEWQIWVRLNFSPSDNNNARIYLASDQSDLKQPLNGYFLKLGESGSNDAIELYRQSGTVELKISRGTDGFLATAFTIRIKVIRTEEGQWSVYADQAGGQEFLLQSVAEESYWQSYSALGIVCKYTSSNATRFYFDDLYAGPPLIDHQAPELKSLEVTGLTQLALTFNEIIDQSSAESTSNYSADQGLGQPEEAMRNPEKKSQVLLTFSQPFEEGKLYNLNVQGVKDLAGNVMSTTSLPFSYYRVKAFDVLINEIMADPDPVVALPNYEYLELYNHTAYPLQLADWVLSIGTSKKLLPAFTLQPGAHLILTSFEAEESFASYGDVLTFSSFSLTNSGATLVLRNTSGEVIHAVNYSDTWYRDGVKKNGGWSLELIDPDNPCGEGGNWRASNAPEGGTPGKVNSVKGSNPDSDKPDILKVSITGPASIQVFFTEPMDSLSLTNTTLYQADQGLGQPQSLQLKPPFYRSVELNFSKAFADGIIYTLNFNAGLSDCAGNVTDQPLSARFAFPVLPDSIDVIINEVLADPRATGTTFIEIYNRSEKVLDLKTIWLATRDKNTGEIASVKETSPEGRLFFPGEYLVLSKDGSMVRSEYFSPAPKAFVDMASLPSFSIAAGTVVLLTPWQTILDEFSYTDKMQFALLNTSDGVSLERVNPDRPASDPGNWHSASQNVGFATPGYQNSQFMTRPESEDEVVISPEIFSPDNDGYNDQLSIACNFSQPGYSATIRIYDSNGRLVRLLVKNQPAGTGNIYYWDGLTDDRTKALIGIYIIHIEVFNLGGKVKQFKKTAVLGGRL